MIFALAAVTLLAGCRADDPDVGPAELDNVTMTLRLHMASGHRSQTRAERGVGDLEPSTPGYADDKVDENAIENIYLFADNFYSADGSIRGERQMVTPSQITNLGNNTYQLQFSKIPVGTMTLYVGANLSSLQAHAFLENNEVYKLQGTDYRMINDIAPFLTTNPEMRKRNTIAMFCDEPVDVTIGSSTDVVVPETVEMRRLVAKVLLTAKETTHEMVGSVAGVDYVQLANELVFDRDLVNSDGVTVAKKGTNRGWIRISDVRYIVNGLNRSTYIMQKTQWNEEAGKEEVVDPNMNLMDYVSTTGGVNEPTGYEDDFIHNSLRTIYPHLQHGDFTPAVKYDESRIPGASISSANDYYEGVYAPENVFSSTELTDAQRKVLTTYNHSWPQVTSVGVGARFVPRDLVIEEGLIDYILADDTVSTDMKQRLQALPIYYERTLTSNPDSEGNVKTHHIYRIVTDSEAMSHLLLTESLKKEHFYMENGDYNETGGLPDNSYFAIAVEQGTKTEFLTFGAAKICEYRQEPDQTKWVNTFYLGSFIPYIAGWNFFYSYIDNRPDTEKTTTFDVTDAQVERNVYYIMTVNKITIPGSTLSHGRFIELHTRIVDWTLGGTGKIELN